MVCHKSGSSFCNSQESGDCSSRSSSSHKNIEDELKPLFNSTNSLSNLEDPQKIAKAQTPYAALTAENSSESCCSSETLYNNTNVGVPKQVSEIPNYCMGPYDNMDTNEDCGHDSDSEENEFYLREWIPSLPWYKRPSALFILPVYMAAAIETSM